MLTRKQRAMLMLIHDKLREDGVPPSFDEMKDGLGLRSKSGVHRLMIALEDRGFIRRMPYRARAVEVLRLPADMAGMPEPDTAKAAKEEAKEGTFAASVVIPFPQAADDSHADRSDGPGAAEDSIRYIPLVGRIAAGSPIEALQQNLGQIGVPAAMIGAGADHYALKVKGDSMIGEGIFDGDTVIIRQENRAENGAIVVALIGDEEATLKRIHSHGDRVLLRAANPDHEDRIYRRDRICVQGRLVGLMRLYS